MAKVKRWGLLLDRGSGSAASNISPLPPKKLTISKISMYYKFNQIISRTICVHTRTRFGRFGRTTIHVFVTRLQLVGFSQAC